MRTAQVGRAFETPSARQALDAALHVVTELVRIRHALASQVDEPFAAQLHDRLMLLARRQIDLIRIIEGMEARP